jgi:hypothetical protein
MSGEEHSRGGIVELIVITTLNSFDGAVKLCGDKGEKIDKAEKVSDLTQRKSPHKMGAIINND